MLSSAPVPLRRVAGAWWPLAASWLLMAVELPALSAVVARLAQPEINLAAYGGVVFPLALIIEAPIMMLLSASTALSKDGASYAKIRRFMMAMGAALTLLHIAVAFTPLYYVLARGLIGAPAEIIEPARLGLMIMTPWSWAIAYRRFHQGVLIRTGHARSVSVGTAIRLLADVTVLTIGYLSHALPGVVVATLAITAGVLSEAAYVGLRVRPVLRDQVRSAPPAQPPLTRRIFLAFYAPLALTSLLNLVVQPLGSAALSRMPDALHSLALWPVVGGLLFMVRSLGFAYNEVVVALLDEPGAAPTLRRFAWILTISSTGLLTLLAATPLAGVWFQRVAALSPALAELARSALWLALPAAALSATQSWFQGRIMHGRQTRSITESVAAYLAVSIIVLGAGVVLARFMGLYVGLAAMTLGTLAQTAWLAYRSRRLG